MTKIRFLFSILIFCITNSVDAMLLRFVPDDAIGDFGILGKASEDDKKAHRLFMSGLAPIVLVTDNYKKEDEASRILKNIVSFQTALETEASRMPTDINKVSIATLAYSYHSLFEQLRELAVVYSARGTYVGPKSVAFSNVMGCVLSCAIEGAVKSRKLAIENLEADKYRWIGHYSEERAKVRNLEAQLEKLKKDHQKLVVENKDLAKDDAYKAKLLGQAVDAMNGLEKSEADLKAKITQQEKVALEVAKAAIELEERNEELQEHSARSRREKVELIQDFEKIIKDARDRADQKEALALVAELRKEMSPVRRQISPMRRQVASQAVALEQKDAEIARLRSMLDVQSDKK